MLYSEVSAPDLENLTDHSGVEPFLCEIEELETEEICRILGLTRTNPGALLHGVRNRLRECLETKGIGHS